MKITTNSFLIVLPLLLLLSCSSTNASASTTAVDKKKSMVRGAAAIQETRKKKRRSLEVGGGGMGDGEILETWAPIEPFPTRSPYPSEAPVTDSPTKEPTPLPTPTTEPPTILPVPEVMDPEGEGGGEGSTTTTTEEEEEEYSGFNMTGVGFIPCFSSESTVQVENHGIKRMAELKLGDRILTSKEEEEGGGGANIDNYEPIYSFGHYDTSTTTTYLQLLPSKMEISPSHLLFIKSSSSSEEEDDVPIPAGQLRVGDVLRNGQILTGIRTVKRRGAYAPFTKSGTLLVNDQMASCFISLQHQQQEGQGQDTNTNSISKYVTLKGGWSTGISHHMAAKVFETPHRLFVSMTAKEEEEESYTVDGISTWVATPRDFFTWLLVLDDASSWSLFLQLMVLIPIFGFVGTLFAMEQFWSIVTTTMTNSYYYIMAAAAAAVVVVIYYCGGRNSMYQFRAVKTSTTTTTRKMKSE